MTKFSHLWHSDSDIMLGTGEYRWVIVIVCYADVQIGENSVGRCAEILHLEPHRVISESTAKGVGGFEPSRPVIGLLEREEAFGRTDPN